MKKTLILQIAGALEDIQAPAWDMASWSTDAIAHALRHVPALRVAGMRMAPATECTHERPVIDLPNPTGGFKAVAITLGITRDQAVFLFSPGVRWESQQDVANRLYEFVRRKADKAVA